MEGGSILRDENALQLPLRKHLHRVGFLVITVKAELDISVCAFAQLVHHYILVYLLFSVLPFHRNDALGDLRLWALNHLDFLLKFWPFLSVSVGKAMS